MATEPMTAAEARKLVVWPYGTSERILAALEEREALLGERAEWSVQTARQIGEVTQRHQEEVSRKGAAITDLVEQNEALKSDAAVGALVRRILDHPAATRGHSAFVYTHNGTWTTAWTEKGLQLTLSHLDSLLPKEPEVAPSGWTYERVTDSTHYWRIAESGLSFSSATATCIPPIDREYVEKMIERANAN